MKGVSDPAFIRWFMLLGVALAIAWWESDTRTRGLLWNSVALGVSVVACSLPIGVALGWLIHRTDLRGWLAAERALTAMLFLPLYLQAAGWDAGFGRQGWLAFGWDQAGTPVLSGWRAAVWIHTVVAIPWVVWATGLAFRHVDPEVEELASLELSPWAAFRRVTLPAVRPALVAVGLWVFVLTAGEMTVTDLYQVRTFAEETYSMSLLSEQLSGDAGGELARTPHVWGWLSLIACCSVWSIWLLRWDNPFLRSAAADPRRWSLGRHRTWLSLGVAGCWLFVVGVPLANVLYNAGVRVESVGGELVRSWSPVKVSEVVGWAPIRFARELGWTTVIGSLSASLAAMVAIPAGWQARRGGGWLWFLVLGAGLGLAIPGPTWGLWLAGWFSRPEPKWIGWLYDHSIAAPVLATVVRAFPPAVLVTWYGFRSFPPELIEAARVDGLSAWQCFWRVVWPMRWQFALAGWLAAFLVAAGDLSTSILVTPPGLFTVPVRLFGLLHAGVDDQVAGLCLANAGLVIVLQAILRRLFAAAARS